MISSVVCQGRETFSSINVTIAAALAMLQPTPVIVEPVIIKYVGRTVCAVRRIFSCKSPILEVEAAPFVTCGPPVGILMQFHLGATTSSCTVYNRHERLAKAACEGGQIRHATRADPLGLCAPADRCVCEQHWAVRSHESVPEFGCAQRPKWHAWAFEGPHRVPEARVVPQPQRTRAKAGEGGGRALLFLGRRVPSHLYASAGGRWRQPR